MTPAAPRPANVVPCAGDVLHHPAFGFATITATDGAGVLLLWERQGSTHPVHVSYAALAGTYRSCTADGLFTRSVREPDAARRFVESEPVGALVLLLAEVDHPLERADVREWLLSRRLSSAARFDAWWEAVWPLLGPDGRLVVRDTSVALRDDRTQARMPGAPSAALPAAGTLPAAAAFGFGLRLARALADLHMAGRGLSCSDPAGARPDRRTIEMNGDSLHFRVQGASSGPGRRADVRFVVRLLLEQVLGPLPAPTQLAEADLVPLLGGLPVTLPLELVAVALDCLAEDAALRPADGFALWERLHAAEAVHRLRATVPWAPNAEAGAGFDTHVGVNKSLRTQTNQDAFLLAGAPTHSLLCVADGISRCNAGSGDLASGLTVRTLRDWWADEADALRDVAPPRVYAAVEGALDRANHVVCEGSLRLGGAADPFVPMGTTVALALTRGNRVHVATLGDSRVYLIGRHGVALLTGDQSVQGERLRRAVARAGTDGSEAPAAGAWSEGGASLVGYVGHFGEDGAPRLPPVQWRTLHLLPGEWLILCSDGLTDYAGAEEASIGTLLTTSVHDARGATLAARAMDVCRTLVTAANRGGGGDNITVLALTLSGEYGASPAGGPVPS